MPPFLSLEPHTVYICVGPSGCGKSTFYQNSLTKSLYPPVYISSDMIRRELLNGNHHKYDRRMMQVSDQAFNLLFTRLRLFMSYPVNALSIYVDTTGLSDHFRASVKKIADENHYRTELLVFDYEDTADYFKYNDGDDNTLRIIKEHLTRFKNKVLSQIKKEKYHNINYFKSHPGTHNFLDYRLEIYNKTYHLSDQSSPYLIIGDVHECTEELQALVEKVSSDTRIILLGDIVDKGDGPEKIVNFLLANERFLLIKGNHDSFVYKYLTGELKPDIISEDMKRSYFTSISYFQADAKLRDKFLILYDRMKEFYIHPDFIAHHAPCPNKYLGKIDNESLRRQRNFRYAKREDHADDSDHMLAIRKDLQFLKDEAVKNHPMDITGHIAMTSRIKYNNKIMIDTGCVDGGYLTGVFIKNGEHKFVSVPSTRHTTKNLLGKLF